jgi:hypothetical protein
MYSGTLPKKELIMCCTVAALIKTKFFLLAGNQIVWSRQEKT